MQMYSNVPGFASIAVANFTATLISADDGAYVSQPADNTKG
jgi:hypothetical protein